MSTSTVPMVSNSDNNGLLLDAPLIENENNTLLVSISRKLDNDQQHTETDMQVTGEDKTRLRQTCTKGIKPYIFIILGLVAVTALAISIFAIVRVQSAKYNNESKSDRHPLSANANVTVRFQLETTAIHQSNKKVLFVIVDGIPADVIEAISTPNMRKIADIGHYKRAYIGGHKGTYSETPTISAPGYMDLITGTWGNKHNVFDNDVNHPNYNYKNIFRLLKEQQPHKTAAIFSTWTDNRVKLVGEGLKHAGGITFDYKFDGYELDRITYPRDPEGYFMSTIDERVVNETVNCVQSFGPDLSWVYLEYTDDVAHKFGDSDQFNQSILLLDEQIGRIYEAIEYRQKYFGEDWLMIVTTDHGRDPTTGQDHGGQSERERTVWIIMNQRNTNEYFLKFQPATVDLLPTMARFLDLSIPVEATQELDGVPLIGSISLAQLETKLLADKIELRWNAFDHSDNVTIWLSTTNLFKHGAHDEYYWMGTVPAENEAAIIDIKKYRSNFYKIVVAGRHNTVNQWVLRSR